MKLLVQKHWQTEEEIEIPDGLIDKEIPLWLITHNADKVAAIRVITAPVAEEPDKRCLVANADWVGTTVIDENRDDLCVAHWTKE